MVREISSRCIDSPFHLYSFISVAGISKIGGKFLGKAGGQFVGQALKGGLKGIMSGAKSGGFKGALKGLGKGAAGGLLNGKRRRQCFFFVSNQVKSRCYGQTWRQERLSWCRCWRWFKGSHERCQVGWIQRCHFWIRKGCSWRITQR